MQESLIRGCKFEMASIRIIIALNWAKNLVFAMTIKLNPELWGKQEIPEKFWK